VFISVAIGAMAAAKRNRIWIASTMGVVAKSVVPLPQQFGDTALL
jgi:hypothetical protein